ncbi:hypothetical protein PWG71_27950 [Nocardiopsis sp. N85]|nr:hypothetical protein [Nocardiopsis sp. N85]MDE3725231.1 hypothetical protein [Nocardiopsis sp. N85]
MTRLVRLMARLVNLRCPTCGVYYDPSSPADSHPHNNH